MKAWVGLFIALALAGAVAYGLFFWFSFGGWIFEKITIPVFLFFQWGPSGDFDFIGAIFWGILSLAMTVFLFMMPYVLVMTLLFFLVQHLMNRMQKR